MRNLHGVRYYVKIKAEHHVQMKAETRVRHLKERKSKQLEIHQNVGERCGRDCLSVSTALREYSKRKAYLIRKM